MDGRGDLSGTAGGELQFFLPEVHVAFRLERNQVDVRVGRLAMRILDMQEAALVWGGVDKKAQDALYTIGYVLGVIARFIGALFLIKKDRPTV